MTKFYLAYTSFVGEKDQQVFAGCEVGAEPKIISFNELSLNEKEIIIFNAPPLIDYLRKTKTALPGGVIDIFQIFKQVRGRQKKYHKASDTQLLWVVFNEFIENQEQLKDVIRTLTGPSSKVVENALEEKLLIFVKYMADVHQKLLASLIKKNEIERYETIEKPFNEILIARQYEGIFLSSKLLNERIDHLKKESDKINKKLRYEYDISSLRCTNEIKSALEKNGLRFLSKLVSNLNSKSFWSFVKAGSTHNQLLKLLHDLYKISFDKNELTKIVLDEQGKAFPFFDCYGTITSRTQVRTPHIQQLKRTSRDIVIAKEGHSLIYADYSQFEPGILASLAKDEKLIDYYNNEDLYSILSIELFGNSSYRPLSKTIFLSFMYGMSSLALDAVVKEYFDGLESKSDSKVLNFFDKFKNLRPFKKELEELALKEKRIGSSLGNYRYFNITANNRLLRKERRCVLSQRIQGTASLILKTAIMSCCQDKEIEFLIPMHDAALFQVPAGIINEKKTLIGIEFENAMVKFCPDLKPKVIFKEFTA